MVGHSQKPTPEEEESGEEYPFEVEDPEYVYRLCRPDENPDEGLQARDPSATDVTVSSHVHGKKSSPFISTCGSIQCIEMYIGLALEKGFTLGKVVKINLTRLRLYYPDVDIVDLSDPNVINREFKDTDKRGRNYASKYQEILIRGYIPPDCVEVIDEEELEESTEYDVDDYSSEDGDEDFYNDEEGQPDYEQGDDDDEQTKRRKLSYPDNEDEEQGEYNERACKSGDKHAGDFEDDDSDDESGLDIKDEAAATKELERLTTVFKQSLEEFISNREKTIKLLKELVELLNDCRTRGNITKISGAGVSIVGAVAAVASIPLTGGLSALALTAGSLISIGGGITGIGGDIYTNSREKQYMNEANTILNRDQEMSEQLNQAGSKLRCHVKRMSKIGIPEIQMFRIMTTAYTNTMVAARLLGITDTFAKIGKATKGAAGGIAKAGRFAKGAGVLISVVFVPLDIWQIVDSSSELQQDNSEKAQQVENVIKDLEKDLEDKKGFLKSD